MKKGNYTISSILKGSKTIEKILKGTITIYESFIELIASGVPPITLQKCKGVDLVDYKIYGDSKQQNKNLLNYSNNVLGSLLVTDGSINNKINYVTTTDFISLKAGTYTISYKTGANLRYVAWFNENKEIVGNVWSGRVNPFKFTIDKDYLVRFDIERDGNVAIENLNTFLIDYEVQLEEGSTATDYVLPMPTMDAPIEIESVGDKTNNLIKLVRDTFTQAGVTFTKNEDGTYTLNGTATSTADVQIIRSSDTNCHIPVYTGKYYKVSSTVISGSYTGNYTLNVCTYDGDTLLKWAWLSHLNTPKTPDIDCMVKLVLIYMKEGTIFNNFRLGLQMEEVENESSTATEFEPYGYRIPIKVRGKNHINIKHLGDINNWDTTPTYGSYEISLPNGNYIFNIETDLEEYKSNILFLSKNKSSSTNPIANIISGYGGIIDKQLKFTITNNEKIYLNWYNGTKNQSNLTKLIDDVLINFIIEDGNVFTGYEPYIEPVTTNIYLNEPLRKIGKTADYIDFKDQKVIRTISTDVFDGSTINLWDTYGENRVYYGYRRDYDNVSMTISGIKCLCNGSQGIIGYAQIWYGDTLGCYAGKLSSSAAKTSFVITSTKPTLEEFKQEITEKPLSIIYISKTSRKENIELPNILLNKGTNVIEFDTLNPSNMEVVYWGKGKLQTLIEEDNIVLNSILGTDTETEIDITDTEINQILDEIIGG